MSRVSSVSALLLVSGASFCLAGCKMSDRDYCEKRQAAWDRAYTHETPTPEEHEKFIRSCAIEMSKQHASGDFGRRVKCLEDNVKGVHADAEYQALLACEGGMPAPKETAAPKSQSRP